MPVMLLAFTLKAFTSPSTVKSPVIIDVIHPKSLLIKLPKISETVSKLSQKFDELTFPVLLLKVIAVGSSLVTCGRSGLSNSNSAITKGIVRKRTMKIKNIFPIFKTP